MLDARFSHPLVAGIIATIVGGLVLLAVQRLLDNGGSPKPSPISVEVPRDEKADTQTTYGKGSPNIKDVGAGLFNARFFGLIVGSDFLLFKSRSV